MNFNNLKIGTRLGGAFAAVLVLVAVMLATALWQLARIAEAKHIMTDTNHKAKLAEEWLQGIATNSVRTLAKAKTTEPADEQRYDEEMKAVSQQVSKVQKELEARVESEHGKALLAAVAAQRKRYSAIRDDAFRRKAEQGAQNDAFQAFVDDKMVPEMKQYVRTVEAVVAYQESLFAAADKQIDALQASARRLLVGLGIAALGCGALFGWLAFGDELQPLRQHLVALGLGAAEIVVPAQQLQVVVVAHRLAPFARRIPDRGLDRTRLARRGGRIGTARIVLLDHAEADGEGAGLVVEWEGLLGAGREDGEGEQDERDEPEHDCLLDVVSMCSNSTIEYQLVGNEIAF